MSMELNHSFTVPVPPDQAWNVLLDVEKIAPCMPGAQVDTVDGDDVAGQLKVKVGPVSLTYKGTATFKDRDTAERSVLVEASGKETRGSGTASATVRAALSPEDSSDSGTLVTLHTTLSVTGKPAQFGRGVIAEVGSRLIDKFADNLAKELANGAVAPAAAAAPAAGTPAPAAGPDIPDIPDIPDATAATTASEATSNGAPPAAAPSGAAPSAAAATAAASAAPAAAPAAHVPVQAAPEPVQPVPVQHQDSLNLLSLVGPVIAKRLAPVAGAAAAVGLLIWGVRRILRRRKSA
jgi:carbon monoxide dehydrogenase subunit G